jgi:hypothetical protein
METLTPYMAEKLVSFLYVTNIYNGRCFFVVLMLFIYDIKYISWKIRMWTLWKLGLKSLIADIATKI